MRGNPEKLSDDTKLIRQDFAELNGKRTDEIGDRRGGDRKSKGKILPNDPHEGKRTDEILELRQDFAEVKGKESVHEKRAWAKFCPC